MSLDATPQNKNETMQGFALLERRGGRLDTVASLFASLEFAGRVSSLFGVSSFHTACIEAAEKVIRDGVQYLPQLQEKGLSVVAKRVRPLSNDVWLALALVEDPNQAKELALLSGTALLDTAAASFLGAWGSSLPSIAGRNLSVVLCRLEELLEDGSDPELASRVKEGIAHVDRMIAAQAAQSLPLVVQLLQTPPLEHTPPPPPEVSPPPELPPLPASPAGGTGSRHGSSRVVGGVGVCIAPFIVDDDEADKGDVVAVSSEVLREEKFLSDHCWLVAGASVWHLQSDGQAKNRVELYKSGAFARDVAAAAGSPTFQHFCRSMVKRFVTGEALEFGPQSKRYPVYGRWIKQSVGPNFVFIIVFDGMDMGMIEKFESVNHSKFLAYVASAFAEQSEPNMSKKLSNVRATLKLLDELDNRRDARGEFVLNVRRKVDRLLNMARYSRFVREKEARRHKRSEAQAKRAANGATPTAMLKGLQVDVSSRERQTKTKQQVQTQVQQSQTPQKKQCGERVCTCGAYDASLRRAMEEAVQRHAQAAQAAQAAHAALTAQLQAQQQAMAAHGVPFVWTGHEMQQPVSVSYSTPAYSPWAAWQGQAQGQSNSQSQGYWEGYSSQYSQTDGY